MRESCLAKVNMHKIELFCFRNFNSIKQICVLYCLPRSGFWESLINLPSACSGSRDRIKKNQANANTSGSGSQTHSREEEVTMELQSVADVYVEPIPSPHNCQTTSLMSVSPHCSTAHPLFVSPTTEDSVPPPSLDCEEEDDEDEEEDEMHDDDDFVYRISWKSPGKSVGIKTKDLLYS